jgi:hypothetical protein
MRKRSFQLDNPVSHEDSFNDPAAAGSQHSCLWGVGLLLAVNTTILLFLSLLMLSLRITLLSPSFLKTLPIQSGLYDQLPDLVSGAMLTEMEDPLSAAEFERAVGRPAIEDLAAALLPLAWVQEQIENNIDGLFAWLEDDVMKPELGIELGELKAISTGDEVRERLRNLFENLPPCEKGEEDIFREMPLCRPPDAVLEANLDQAILVLQAYLPPRSPHEGVAWGDDVLAIPPQQAHLVQRSFRIFMLGSTGSWFLCLTLFTLILLLTARRFGDILTWLGWPFLLTGGLSFLSKFSLFAFALFELHRFHSETTPSTEFEPAFIADLGKILRALLKELFLGAAVPGLLAALLGAGALGMGIYLRRLRGD